MYLLNSEVFVLDCDYTKLNKFTGFTPKVNLETGLKKTISWVRKNIKNNNYKDYLKYNI